MKKYIIFLFLFLNFFLLVRAQDEIQMPSLPSVSELNKFISNPVSFQSGLADISVPIYTLDVNGYKLPIGLSYYSGGVKVDQRATEVGLSWSLNAGGTISRTTRGLPDEYKDNPNTRPVGGVAGALGWLHAATTNFIYQVDIEAEENKLKTDRYYMFNQFMPLFFKDEFQTHQDRYTTVSHKLKYDPEPDIFTFSFNGKSGSFVFDNQKIIRQYPLSDLKIEYTLGNIYPDSPDYITITSFTIQDTDGSKYFFSAVGSTVTIQAGYSLIYNETSYHMNYGWNRYDGSDQEVGGEIYHREDVSWHLTKIETPNNDVITLNYDLEKLELRPVGGQYSIPPSMRTESNINFLMRNGEISWTGVFNSSRYILIKQSSPRIRSIETNTSIIEFEKGAKRMDEGPDAYPISGISVYYKVDVNTKTLVKKTALDYIYAVSPSSTSGDTDGSRLILKSIREIDVQNPGYSIKRSFGYKLFEFNGNEANRLPRKKGFAVDIWGNYNGADMNTSYVPTVYIYPDLDTGNRRFRTDRLTGYVGREFIFVQSDRTTNGDFADIGMLTSVTYSTGGYTKYQYEPNDFLDEGRTVKGGGLRIRSIENHDGTKSLTHTYTYHDAAGNTYGRIYAKPFFAGFRSGIPVTVVDDEAFFKKNIYCFGTSQGEISNVNGNHVGYKQVTEKTEGNGYSVYKYSFPGAIGENNDRKSTINSGSCSIATDVYCDDIYHKPKVYLVAIGGSFSLKPQMQHLNPLSDNSFPYPPELNYNWNRGHLLEKELFDVTGSKIKSERYGYINYTRSYDAGKPRYVYGLKMGKTPYIEEGHAVANRVEFIFYRMSKYAILTDIIKLPAYREETSYFKNGEAPITTREDIFYGTQHLNAVKKIYTNSDGSKEETELKYPNDFEIDADWAPVMSSNWLIYLNVMKRNNLPVEIVRYNYKGNLRYFVNGSFTSFVLKRGNLIDEVMSFETDYPPIESTVTKSHFSGPNLRLDSRFKKKNKYTYNAVGKPTRIEENGINIFYIYGYKDQYPVAKIEGLGDDGIPPTYYNQDILNSGDNVEQQLILLRNQYKNNPEVQIETYTYKPLVGMTSKTDARGDTEYYIYDGFGRLKSILDRNKNVVKDYQYNYRP